MDIGGYPAAVHILLTLLLSSGFATDPSPDLPAVDTEQPSDAFSDALDAALETYLSGDLVNARVEMRRLSRDSRIDAHERRNEVLIYLAEVEYYLGERESSWETCRTLLSISPDFKVDPFVHPPELVAFFESVRTSSIQAPTPSSGIQENRVPAWAVLVPGGIQLHRDQETIGILALAGVGSLATTSTGLYFALRRYDLDLQRPGIQVNSLNDKERAEQLLFWTNLTRWTTLGLYGGSLIHGLFTTNGIGPSGTVSLTPTGVLFTWDWP